MERINCDDPNMVMFVAAPRFCPVEDSVTRNRFTDVTVYTTHEYDVHKDIFTVLSVIHNAIPIQRVKSTAMFMEFTVFSICKLQHDARLKVNAGYAGCGNDIKL